MSTSTDVSEIKEKINEIEAKSTDANYIYRREPRCHKKVSANLYRLAPGEFDFVQLDPENI